MHLRQHHWIALCFLAAGLAAWTGAVQAAKLLRPVPLAPAPVANVPDSNVSIMTEALPATAGTDEDSIGELARAYSLAGLSRILPVRGLGPIANMRDLLHMRGIDMAVVNADILSYARIASDLRGVDTRLSAVAKLYDKTIYLVAAQGIATVGDLANKRVLVPGADSDSFVTARAMFGELSIPVDLAGVDLGLALSELTSGKAQALLMTLEDDDHTLATLPPDKGLHILPIPDSPALTKIYGRKVLTDEDTNGLVAAPGGTTITVSSLLATFNWRPTHARYSAVLQFLRTLPKVVGQLRASDPKGFWNTLDGRAELLGWPRYEPARPVLASIVPVVVPLTAPQAVVAKPSVKSLATSSALSAKTVPVTPAKSAPKPEPAPAEAAAQAPAPMDVEVAAFAMAVLANAKDPKGGLVAEIVRASLKSDMAKLTWLDDDKTVLKWLADARTARIAFPFARPDCGAAEGQTATTKDLCDHFAFSKPIFQSLQVFFARHGSDFTFERDDQLVGRSVCAAAGYDLASLNSPSHHWIKDDLITLLRRPTLDGCFGALENGDVDAVFADDLEGRGTLEKLRLDDKIEVVRRPVATIEISAAAAKDNAEALAALQRLDVGVAALKADSRYSDIVMGRLGQQQLSGDVPALQ